MVLSPTADPTPRISLSLRGGLHSAGEYQHCCHLVSAGRLQGGVRPITVEYFAYNEGCQSRYCHFQHMRVGEVAQAVRGSLYLHLAVSCFGNGSEGMRKG